MNLIMILKMCTICLQPEKYGHQSFQSILSSPNCSIGHFKNFISVKKITILDEWGAGWWMNGELAGGYNYLKGHKRQDKRISSVFKENTFIFVK